MHFVSKKTVCLQQSLLILNKKYCSQVSTLMKLISNKNGDLLSQFDNINENDIPTLERITDLPPQI